MYLCNSLKIVDPVVKANLTFTLSKSNGCVQHAAPAEPIPPKYYRENFLLLSLAAILLLFCQE